jgi:transposase InsO family protein
MSTSAQQEGTTGAQQEVSQRSPQSLLREDDPTSPQYNSAKVTIMLQADGLNLPEWKDHVLDVAVMKNVHTALLSALPKTKGDIVARSLLTGSIPAIMLPELRKKGSASEAFEWVIGQFEGGKNTEVNDQWLHKLESGRMSLLENFDEYVAKKLSLKDALVRNGHQVSGRALRRFIVDNLPGELESVKQSLELTLNVVDAQAIPGYLRAAAQRLHFDDTVPREPPSVRAVGHSQGGVGSNSPGSQHLGGRGMGRFKNPCYKCGRVGHNYAQCRQPFWNDPTHPLALRERAQAAGAGVGGSGTPSPQLPHAARVSGSDVEPPLPGNAGPCVPMGEIHFVTVDLSNKVSAEQVLKSDAWLIDTGATVHVVNDLSMLQNPQIYSVPLPLTLATSDAVAEIVAVGDVTLNSTIGGTFTLRNVRCVPSAATNLISVSAFTAQGGKMSVNEKGEYKSMHGNDNWECPITLAGGLYYLGGSWVLGLLDENMACATGGEKKATNPWNLPHSCHMRQLWHERMGHPGSQNMVRLQREQAVQGVWSDLAPCPQCETVCDACVRGKQTRSTHSSSGEDATTPLERVHLDTVGELPHPALTGERYFVTIVDGYSKAVEVKAVHSKAEIPKAVKDVLLLWENQTNCRVKIVRSDRGTEFVNAELKTFFAEKGIKHETSAPYTPQQNGTAERMNRTLKEKVRCMLLGVAADESLWLEALKTAVLLRNVTYVTACGKTPFEILWGRKPKVQFLRTWGCMAYVKPPKVGQSTLGAQALQGMFVGYELGSKAYRVRVGRKIYVSFDVRFVEHQSGARAAGLERVDVPSHPSPHDFGPTLTPTPITPEVGVDGEVFFDCTQGDEELLDSESEQDTVDVGGDSRRDAEQDASDSYDTRERVQDTSAVGPARSSNSGEELVRDTVVRERRAEPLGPILRRSREERAAHRNAVRSELEQAQVRTEDGSEEQRHALERDESLEQDEGSHHTDHAESEGQDGEGDDVEPSCANARSSLNIPEDWKHSSVSVPKNMREARASPQWQFWQFAMQEEKDSLDANNTMEYVRRPVGRRVIPVHWIFSLKTDSHGNITRFKARLVAQGCRQISGVDYGEVFAPVSSFGARRAILCKAAQEDLEIHQVDIKTAFLHGVLEEEVYVTQPPGFENGDVNTVCRLVKSLYGLKQAPRAWHKKLSEALSKWGFKPCKSDAGVFKSNEWKDCTIFLPTYVDDLLIICKDLRKVTWLKEQLKLVFEIHDLGEVKDFLGCEVTRDRKERVLYMSSTKKIEELAAEYGVTGLEKPVSTPMGKDFLQTAQAHTEDDEGVSGAGVPLEPGHRYCELLGSLQYLATTVRPDIAQAAGVLARYRNSPNTSHWNAAIRVVRYLLSTKAFGLRLGGSHSPCEGFVDANFAGDLDDCHSTSGFVFKVYGGAVTWASKKQHVVATSTVEAEYMAASVAVKEASWLRSLLEEFEIPVSGLPLHCDSTGCIHNLTNPVTSKYTKHISVLFHYAREQILLENIQLMFIRGESNLADMFTKPLLPEVFRKHREALGVVPMISVPSVGNVNHVL